MAPEAEVMEARLGPDHNSRTLTAMAADAGTFSASIGKVVVTHDAVHLAMLVVRKAQYQRFGSAHERLTQRQSRSIGQQQKQRHEGTENQHRDEPRMPSEYESTKEPACLSRLALRSRTQQSEQHHGR